ncbi:MAG: SxtJ family membrane protein [bacterium]
MDIKKLRKFGLASAVILGIIGLLFHLRDKELFRNIMWGIAGYSLFFGIIFPRMVFPFYWFMSWFGKILGWINTRIILSLLFFLLMTPLGLFFRLIRKNTLNLKIDRDADSYWDSRQGFPQKDSYERQF